VEYIRVTGFSKSTEYEVAIVGAGPAGLNAALLLGRCRRRTVVLDAGQPRNASAKNIHGFLTRDGITPGEFLRITREQLRPYSSVEVRSAFVQSAARQGDFFQLQLRGGGTIRCRKVILATGVVDTLPTIDGVKQMYGKSVFHCPYCDGWELRDQPLAVYGKGKGVLGLAGKLRIWSRDLVICTDGSTEWDTDDEDCWRWLGAPVRTERVVRLEGTGGQLERIVFEGGDALARRGLFFNTGQGQRSNLASQLGCSLSAKESVECDPNGRTCVSGVYVAGDASRDVQLAIIAAAEGARAAFTINEELLKEDENWEPVAGEKFVRTDSN
jgi:thioredoxin reductase